MESLNRRAPEGGDAGPRTLTVARRRWWVIVLTTVVAVGAAVAGLSIATPTYSATATLQAQVVTGLQTAVDPLYVDRVMNTYANFVKQPTLQTDVARRVGLRDAPPLTATVEPNTELLQLSAKDASPELAQRTANAAAAVLVDRAASLAQGTSQAGEVQLSQQLGALSRALTAERLQLLQTPSTPDQSSKRVALTQKISGNEASYQALVQQRAQLQLANAVRDQTLSVVQPAALPTSIASPKRVPVLVLALGLGLLGGLGLALLLERLAPRLYTVEAIESVARADVLAAIPPTVGRVVGPPTGRDSAAAAEAFGVLAVHILAEAEERPLRTILVTSRNPGDGKSTVASNLGAELAQCGHRTLVIDADLRGASLHGRFEVERAPGLSNLLESPDLHELLDEFVVRPPGTPNLGLIPAGPEPHGPARLLASQQLKNLLRSVDESFEFVVFDSPPLVVSDPLSIARHVDLTLLVVGGDDATDRDIQAAKRQLDSIGVKHVSVVVNRWRSEHAAYSYPTHRTA